MRAVTVDPERKVVTAQGGATWGDVDTETVKYGLCTVGGTVSDTGVGGLTLGGGYGWMSGKYGLVIDNLVEATMVLGDGRVVRCSEREEKELFWGVKGAGQNFGVGVEFVFKAWDVPEKGFWAGMLMFDPEGGGLEKVVDCLNRYHAPGNPQFEGRLAGALGLARPPPAQGKTWVLVPIIFQGSEEEGKEVFKELLGVEGLVMSTMASVGYEVVNTILAAPIGMRVSMKGSGFQLPVRAGFVKEVIESFDEFVDGMPDAGASMILWEFFDPTVMVTQSTGGSFANRGFHLSSMIAPFWTEEKNDTPCRQWARDVAEMFKVENKRWGMATGKNGEMRGEQGAVMVYGNYDQYEEKSRDIFGDHYERLQGVKGRYDPGNLFNKLFAITPA
jgi:FAD/FMN-containing dehydrogenase